MENFESFQYGSDLYFQENSEEQMDTISRMQSVNGPISVNEDIMSLFQSVDKDMSFFDEQQDILEKS